jgi:hypothetical protein
MGWQHINLRGDYLWDASSSLGPDHYRSETAVTPWPTLPDVRVPSR